MLWRKTWWESRIMFWLCLATLSGLVVLMMFNISSNTRWVERLQRDAGGWNEETRQALPALATFQGRVWVLWFKLALGAFLPFVAMSWATFAPGCASPWTGVKLDKDRLFMLSLPVSRREILLTQAGMSCGQLWLVAVGSSLLLPVISHWKGQWYSIRDALIFASLSFLGVLVFYFTTLLMMVIFDNGIKSLLLSMLIFAIPFHPSRVVESYPRWHITRLIAGEDYFLHGQIPWLALIVSLLVSASLLYIAVRVFERRDF